VNNVNRMDIATGIWQSRAPMPFTSEAPTCALDASSGMVYCAEGDTGNGFAAYDTATDTWTSLANTPNGDDYGCASGAFNGKVFLAGGTTGFINAVWVYDIAGNTWSAGTAAPDGFLLAGYQQVGQFLYLAGGWTGGAPTGLTTTRRLDMSSAPGTWEDGPTFPMGRSDFGLPMTRGPTRCMRWVETLRGAVSSTPPTRWTRYPWQVGLVGHGRPRHRICHCLFARLTRQGSMEQEISGV